MPPNAGPPMVKAYTLAPRAANRANRLMCPKASDERLLIKGSSTISRVPITVRMISGRKRRASCGLNSELTSMGDLRSDRPGGLSHQGSQPHPVGDVHVGLLQYACRI